MKVENEVIKQDFNQVYSIIDIHRKRAFQEINKIVPFETAQILQEVLQRSLEEFIGTVGEWKDEN